MNLSQAFKMAIKSIFNNKARTVLTMLGIIIGVTAVITLVSLVQGYQASMMDWVEKQGVNRITVDAAIWSGMDISDQLYDYCLGLDDLVLGVTPSSQSGGSLRYQTKYKEYTSVYFGNNQFSLCNNYQLARGRDLSYLDVRRAHRVCVLGDYVASELFGYANPVGKTITYQGTELEVIGVYAAKFEIQEWTDDDMILVPHTLGKSMGQDMYSTTFSVKAKDSDSTTRAVTRLQGFLSTFINDSNGYYYVYTTNTSIEQSNELTNMLSLVLGGIAAIALLVGGIGIMNIMLVTVTERTREIGIRKAIGARRNAIITQFLIEASVISATGGLIGILLGFLLTLVLGKVIFQLVLLPNVAISIGAVVFSVLIGIGFGMYPAVKASGLQPVDALRAE